MKYPTSCVTIHITNLTVIVECRGVDLGQVVSDCMCLCYFGHFTFDLPFISYDRIVVMFIIVLSELYLPDTLISINSKHG